MLDLKEKTILITGGTGFFGKNFTKFLLKNTLAKKIIIFSRDEFKQFQMAKEFNNESQLRFFLGDVRDKDRIERALQGVDIVIHAAALKQVPALEYNPYEAVKTNILGSQNVIESSIDQKIKKILLISSDKASQPINLYGSTKLCAEKLFINANCYSPNNSLFSVARYGNVMGSRGSIIETLLKNRDMEKVQITDPEMTRFWITLEQAFELVMFSLENMEGGEIFIPKIPSMKIIDLFDALCPNTEKEIIGIRPGEKVHETLVSEEESRHTIELIKYFVILNEFNFFSKDAYKKYYQIGAKTKERMRYSSDNNTSWLSKEELLKLVSIC